MTQIFISYSHRDRTFVKRLAKNLRLVYEENAVWYDDKLKGGDVWWNEILDQIADCEIFLFIASPTSVKSDFCLAELDEAHRLKKGIIPVISSSVRLPDDLSDLQHIDMRYSSNESTRLNELYAAINRQAQFVDNYARPLYAGKTPHPGKTKPGRFEQPSTPTDVDVRYEEPPEHFNAKRYTITFRLSQSHTIIIFIKQEKVVFSRLTLTIDGEEMGNWRKTLNMGTAEKSFMIEGVHGLLRAIMYGPGWALKVSLGDEELINFDPLNP